MIKFYSAKITDFTQADYTNAYSLLDCALKRKIDSKSNERAKKLSLLGYILLYKGFNEIFGKKDVKIYFNNKGKPLCDFCCFSISHSKDMAVCVFNDAPIGVDIQFFCDIKARNEYMFFNEKENIYVNYKCADIPKRYIEVFAKKESVIKMLGLSLAHASEIDTFSEKYSFKTQQTDDYIIVICCENG